MRNILFTLLLYAVASNAQNLTIKSVSLQPSDLTAVEQPCLDLNGDTCALLKIKTDNLEGIEFPDTIQYIKINYIDGIYQIYVPTISRKITLHHKDYFPLQFDLAEYGYKKLRAGKTYLIVLDAPKKIDLQSSVIMKVEPKQARVIFDGQKYESSSNGTYELSVSTGNHVYEISAPHYYPQNGSVAVNQSEVKTISVRLAPITHEVFVNCNVKSARVFVDNIDYGKVGKLLIPQGTHTIRVQAEGYVDEIKEGILINAASTNLAFQLQENKRITHIHAVPVTIYSNSLHIYNNNKEIKDWKNGAVIMFMPGKYVLSDDEGKKKIKITVESEPMTVNL